ncbi:histidine phosphatase family protein [Pseudonocardia sp. RS010]|uniref:histidine phosphatase family protein n=1 Tax=Pseudonocardia sp. RS010 TaxID=3385979 RepID=UPI0039A2DC9A
MATRHLYIARHGDADAFGELTDTGRKQARLLGQRLAHLPIDAVWHSPLPRAVGSAQELAAQLRPGTPAVESAELIDHVPYVPTREETPHAWVPFFDGYDPAEAAAGNRIAHSLTARFAAPPEQGDDIHEVLITHSYPIAWLVRDALDAPPARWLSLNSANAALTVIECRPGLPPGITMFNEMSHLPTELRWTGFPPSTWP